MDFHKNTQYSFQVFSSENRPQLKDEIEELRETILSSQDPRKLNYNERYFNLEKQALLTALFLDQKIVALSSVLNRDVYPKGVFRVLNRMWKSDQLRTIEKPYWLVSKFMLDLQLQYCKKIGAKGIFISTEGMRNRWLSSWVKEANTDNQKWHVLPGKFKVAPCDDISCWQNVAYWSLDGTTSFNLPHMSDEEWLKKRESRNASLI